jgi:hypothetical protein
MTINSLISPENLQSTCHNPIEMIFTRLAKICFLQYSMIVITLPTSPPHLHPHNPAMTAPKTTCHGSDLSLRCHWGFMIGIMWWSCLLENKIPGSNRHISNILTPQALSLLPYFSHFSSSQPYSISTSSSYLCAHLSSTTNVTTNVQQKVMFR